MVIPVANSNELVEQRLRNVFLINGTGTQQAEAAVAYMKKSGGRRVALVDDNTSYSVDIVKLTRDRLNDRPCQGRVAVQPRRHPRRGPGPSPCG